MLIVNCHYLFILNYQYLDAILVGPYDLSASLGVCGEFESKTFKDAYETIKKLCLEKDVAFGVHIVQPSNEKLKETQKLIEKGYFLNEGHPECSFRELKGDFLQFGKSGLLGFFERLNLVTCLLYTSDAADE